LGCRGIGCRDRNQKFPERSWKSPKEVRLLRVKLIQEKA
jgi:hypothetical protein